MRFPRRVSVKQFLKARQVGGAQTKRNESGVQRGEEFISLFSLSLGLIASDEKVATFASRLTI